MLKLYKLVLAVNKFFLLSSLQFEELLEDLESLGFFLHGASLLIVLTNLCVGGVNHVLSGVLLAVRESFLEFLSVVKHFDLEQSYATLDVVRLL